MKILVRMNSLNILAILVLQFLMINILNKFLLQYLKYKQNNKKPIMLAINKSLNQIINVVIYKIIIDMLFKVVVSLLMLLLAHLHNKNKFNNKDLLLGLNNQHHLIFLSHFKIMLLNLMYNQLILNYHNNPNKINNNNFIIKLSRLLSSRNKKLIVFKF